MKKRTTKTAASAPTRKRRKTEEESREKPKEETEEESDETDSLLLDCPHVAGFNLDEIQPIVLDPVGLGERTNLLTLHQVNWNCFECGTTEGI